MDRFLPHPSSNSPALCRERAERFWSYDHLLPVPADPPLLCPACGGAFQLQRYGLNEASPSPNARRVDVRVKCRTCGLVLQFGLHWPEDRWREAKRRAGRRIRYREARMLLEVGG